MRFETPLVAARLIRRYKRFLADMQLEDGREVVAHCANPGAMLGMSLPGAACWLEPVTGPRRKLGWSWKLVETGTGLAVVDTGVANRVVAEALAGNSLPGLHGYDHVRREVRLGAASRIDFLLTGPRCDMLVEVKSVTLSRPGARTGPHAAVTGEGDQVAWAEFPDCATARGTRHLMELATAARNGRGAAMLYVAARENAHRIRIAADIDPGYARAFAAACDAGVRMLGLATSISPQGVAATRALPVEVAQPSLGSGQPAES